MSLIETDDAANLLPSLDTQHIELHVAAAAAAGPAGALDPEHGGAQLILDHQSGKYALLQCNETVNSLWIYNAPLLRDASNDSSGWTWHLHLLEIDYKG